MDSRPDAARGDVGRLTAVVLGDECPRSRDVVAALARELWSVRPASDGGRCFAAVAVVDSISANEAAAVVSDARAMGDAVIVVVERPAPEVVRALLQAGADAVVPAESVEAQLGPAMTAVEAGLVVVPPGALGQPAGRPALTPREKQALGMVVLGFSNADIANKLYVAESTVKSHLSSAFAKLGVRTRSEATALILDRSSGLGTGILAIVGDGDADAA
ncbi:MAG TPA: response regulator transcription factor [Gaiellaceae bacterium]|nr:response regulator transcription factor [Gaiellaceae bacterium]